MLARTDRTFNWPVYSDYEAAFRDLAALYEVRPMRVWDPDNQLVPPVEVKDAVHGALVEVLFWMKHCARQKDGQCHNIFTGKYSNHHRIHKFWCAKLRVGVFEQIRILQPGNNVDAVEYDFGDLAQPIVPGVTLGPTTSPGTTHLTGSATNVATGPPFGTDLGLGRATNVSTHVPRSNEGKLASFLGHFMSRVLCNDKSAKLFFTFRQRDLRVTCRA